ncbi:arylamine N-acetyltransferase [Ensifer adhaerens]|uniref:arylamine N-acetyltransferase family protein n=1 Tax=Ensifer canadensis TaxID=555315 RepID=UPI00148FF05D|nr:arylamine N-acetyltransferase [Ensifer canadensis]NOV16554.1 arylamine N-acetyltransferase [Ensifer canadensis]
MPRSAVPVDLDQYFARIGYGGPRSPYLANLRAIIAHHVATIPFEAIDVLLGHRIDLSPAAVDVKLIARRRGGYCFEHNGLFQRVLLSLGYVAEPLIARVLWMRERTAPPPAWSHMALRVVIDGVAYLVDVGFGSCVPTLPLRFDVAAPQPTTHEMFRLTATPEGFLLKVLLAAKWSPVYEVSTRICADEEYDTANVGASTHPHSHFRQQLLVALTTTEARNVLLGNRLTIRHRNGQVDRRWLDAVATEEALINLFGLPFQNEWRRILPRATSTPA